MIERTLHLTGREMALFAAGSGDSSRLHTDPSFARCTPYGECIVYGGVVSIALLGSIPAPALAQVRSIRSSFPGPVLSDARSLARVEEHPSREGAWEARLIGRGRVLARVVAEIRRDARRADATLARASAFESETPPRSPDALVAGDATRGEYRLRPELAALARELGAESLHPALLDGIGWASYAVGMGMPGFEGLCAAVDVTTAAEDVATDGATARAWLHVCDDDERTSRRLVEGVLFGASDVPRTVAQIECFPVAAQPLPDATVLGLVGAPPPLQGTVVVVGGSRGLGAALGLALLARGFAVHLVFAAAPESARGLVDSAGGYAGRLFLHQVDASDPRAVADFAEGLDDVPLAGLVLNAARPPHAMGLTSESGAELATYVAEALRLAAVPLGGLLPLVDRERGWIVVSSSAVVATPARDFPQLVSAKTAVEGLARWAADAAPGVRIGALRVPERRGGVSTLGGQNALASPESLAAWVAERVSDGLPRGLSILDPTAPSATP